MREENGNEGLNLPSPVQQLCNENYFENSLYNMSPPLAVSRYSDMPRPSLNVTDTNQPETAKSSTRKRARGRPANAIKKDIEWEDDETRALIELWSKEPILYNAKHPQHHIKSEKERAINRIINGLKEGVGLEVDDAQVVAKMTSLRSYYSAQKNKEKSSKASGVGTDNVYVSTWKFMKDLTFLSDNIMPRKTISNISTHSSMDDQNPLTCVSTTCSRNI